MKLSNGVMRHGLCSNRFCLLKVELAWYGAKFQGLQLRLHKGPSFACMRVSQGVKEMMCRRKKAVMCRSKNASRRALLFGH
jgi:hypothetical protein